MTATTTAAAAAMIWVTMAGIFSARHSTSPLSGDKEELGGGPLSCQRFLIHERRLSDSAVALEQVSCHAVLRVKPSSASRVVWPSEDAEITFGDF